MALSRFAGWTYSEVMDLDLDEAAFWLDQAANLAENEAQAAKATE